MNRETVEAAMKMVKALKIAIKEVEKLNKLIDDMHNMLHENAMKKAA